jgi:hypothetical protein
MIKSTLGGKARTKITQAVRAVLGLRADELAYVLGGLF